MDTLINKIKKTRAPVVCGLDPHLESIPAHIRADAYAAYGESLAGAAEAIWQFNKAIIDHIYDLIPAVKPQIAMYEQYGIEGLSVFQKTCAYAKEKGLLIIGDIKRGDIGSTAAAYAAAHLGPVRVGGNVFSPFAADFVTVNPYLGSDSIAPFIAAAKAANKGLFVLVKTSNPGSGEFQDRLLSPGDAGTAPRPLYELVAEGVAAWGRDFIDAGSGYSHIGAVVGATWPEQGARLKTLMPKTFFLVPGYGAQGGKAADVVHLFDRDGLGALISSSRGITYAYQEKKYARYGIMGFAEAARAALLDMIKDINGALCSHERA